MAHGVRLTSYRQAQLFTGGLLDHIHINVELHNLQDLQRTMSLARAFEWHNARLCFRRRTW